MARGQKVQETATTKEGKRGKTKERDGIRKQKTIKDGRQKL